MTNQQKSKFSELRGAVARIAERNFRKSGNVFHLNQFRRMHAKSLRELFTTLRDTSNGMVSYEKATVAAAIAVKGKGSKLIMQQLARVIESEEKSDASRMQKLVNSVLEEIKKFE